MKKLVALLFLLTIVNACKTDKILISDLEKVDSLVKSFVDNGSQALLLVRMEDKTGKPIYQLSDKNVNLIPKKTINENTWFRIWSMSKIVTISLTMDLVEDGLLRLDEPVSKYIPEFKNLKVALTNDGSSLTGYAKAMGNIYITGNPCPLNIVERQSEMTVLQLINHQAGFYYGTTGIKCLDEALVMKDLADSKNSDEFVKKLSELPLIDHPGNKSFYGLNTTVLGIVNERASGESLSDLVKNRITDPLKIVGLKYNKNEKDELLPVFSGADSIIRLANNGELDIMGKYVPGYDENNNLFLGGEGMIGTADGYTDFLRMLLNHGKLNGHRFLNESSVKEIYSPHTQLDNEYGYNGYNLWVTSKKSRELGHGDEGLWSGGGYEGTHFWIDPKRDFVGVIMTQMYKTPKAGQNRDNIIKGEIYNQIFKNEN